MCPSPGGGYSVVPRRVHLQASRLRDYTQADRKRPVCRPGSECILLERCQYVSVVGVGEGEKGIKLHWVTRRL